MSTSTDGNIEFSIKDKLVLEFTENGDILIHGRIADNDIETVIAFREWLLANGQNVITNPTALVDANIEARKTLRDKKIKSILKS